MITENLTRFAGEFENLSIPLEETFDEFIKFVRSHMSKTDEFEYARTIEGAFNLVTDFAGCLVERTLPKFGHNKIDSMDIVLEETVDNAQLSKITLLDARPKTIFDAKHRLYLAGYCRAEAAVQVANQS